ncbi:NADH-quinone oxidoreductase subunit C domain protein [Mycobacterium intracellulare 1956]|uniref:NADH-quinone oxidoreductase subunit C domain protein n=1 Tax=Mycobacterium intracellulare 1956 TaxID=1299331 RepID=X8CIY2_MYCIT|nr:NADH-quinone oxidoreductase subunit C domain protein [Mycobacterium intracellulare 1956]
MSSPNQDPHEAIGRADEEVIDVRRGMFGVQGSGDTSGYGRLVREVLLPAAARGPTAATSTSSSTDWPRP